MAWISQQKNTLSGVIFLGSMLAYLRYDETRRSAWYAAALAAYILAVLAKTSTVPLPAALLVILWWRNGDLSARRDVLPLAPFFAVGAVGGLFSAWVERTYCGAEGPDFAFTLIDRCLLAGRAFCFQLGKLVWPADLAFIYPRWTIDSSSSASYLFPAAAIVLIGLAFALQRRSRGPLAAVLFYTLMLLPSLGFVNIGYFTFSFVADHWQYLPSLGIAAAAAAGIESLLDRLGRKRLEARIVGAALCALLGILTWRQSRLYADAETIYRDTVARNPACWLAQNSLGHLLAEKGRPQEAVEHFGRASALRPDYVEAHFNLGMTLMDLGRAPEAVEAFERALAVFPDNPKAHYELGAALIACGRVPEAVAHLEEALRLSPDVAPSPERSGDGP